MRYIFGGNTGVTPDSLAQRRQVARALMQGTGGTPQSLGQGLFDASGKITGALVARKAAEQEEQEQSRASDQFNKLFPSFGGGAPSGPVTQSEAMAATGGPTNAAADWLKYNNQGATRNLPVSDNLQAALDFLPEMGVTMEVFSGGQPEKGSGQPRVGSVRHDHGDAADVFFYKDGRKLDWNNPQDLPVFQEIVSRGRQNGLTGFGAGEGYMQPGSMHIGFGNPAVWGAGGKGANAPAWLREAYEGTAAPQAQGGRRAALVQALSNPFMSEGQRAAIAGELQRIEQQNDPMRQLQMERLQLQNNQMRNPAQEPQFQQVRGVDLGLQGEQADALFNVSPDGKVSQIGGAGTTVNLNTASEVGSIPGGYELFTDPETGARSMRPIAGGPVATEQAQQAQQQERAARTSAETEATRANVVKRTTDSIREKLRRKGIFDLPETGIIGGRLARMGLNQEAVDVAADLQTLQGMVVFDRLATLREAAANGSSGLGQVTNVEIGLLGSQMGALNQDMSADKMLETLDQIDDVFGRLSPEAQAYIMGETDTLPPPSAANASDDVPPDGVDPKLWQYMAPEDRLLFE